MEGEREAIENEKDDLERQFEALKLMVEPYRYYLRFTVNVQKLRIFQHNHLIQGPTWELRDGAPRPSRPERGGGGWSEEAGRAEWSSSWPSGSQKSLLRYSVNICPPCQNHSQKIQHVVKIKQENVQLKTEVVYWIVSEGLLITNVIPKVTRLTEELLKSKRQLGKAEDRRVLITIYETFWGGQPLMTSIQAGRGSRG